MPPPSLTAAVPLLLCPLCRYDRATFYSQGEEGYTDYPHLEDTEEGKAFLAAQGAN